MLIMIVLLGGLLGSLNFFLASKAFAAESPSLLVLSFNTGPFRRSVEERYQRILTIATFIKEKNIEIVGLQEQDYATEEDNDALLYIRAFTELGYPMHIKQVQEDKHEANIILSKYPFVEGTYQEYLLNGRNRIMQRIAIETPYQKRLWIVNLHTNSSRPNNAIVQVGDVLRVVNSGDFAPPAHEPLIIMGDFNVWMHSNGEVDGAEWNNEFRTTTLSNYQFVCQKLTVCYQINNGVEGKKDVMRMGIDWIITTKSSGTIVQETWPDNTIKHVGDGHPPLMGKISHPQFTQPASLLKGDLDADGDVDVFDYNMLLEAFGKNGRNGLNSADIDHNGIVDIFDYNALVENFGK